MKQWLLSAGYLVVKAGKFLLLPLLLVFTFNVHEFVDPQLQITFLWACVFITMFYMQCLIVYLVRISIYRKYIGIIVILIASTIVTLKMLVNQVLHTLSIKNYFFNNYANTIDSWGSWVFFGLIFIWAVARTHKWRSDHIKSDPYDADVVMFGAKPPTTWLQIWNAAIRGDSLSANIAMVNNRIGKFSKQGNKFVVLDIPSDFPLEKYTLKRTDIDPEKFELYLINRHGENTEPTKNNGHEWGNYDPTKYFK